MEKSSSENFFKNPKTDRNFVKHGILKSYLEGFFPKITTQYPECQVVYVDGFSGPGIYESSDSKPSENMDDKREEMGSPLVIYESITNHTKMNNYQKRRVLLIFIEQKKEYAEKLKEKLDEMKKELQSPVSFKVEQGEFAEKIEEILKEYTYCPMSIFLDPFGWKDVSMELLQRIAQRNTPSTPTELLINVMDGIVNRWLKSEVPGTRKSINNFMGRDDEWRSQIINETDAGKRREIFINMYIGSLVANPGVIYYPLKFSMRTKNNRHLYHLLYITFHLNGLKHIKYSMNKISQKASEFVYSEFAATRESPRDFPSERPQIIEDIKSKILATYGNEKVWNPREDPRQFHELEEFILLETPYHLNLENDIKAWFFGSAIKKRFKTLVFKMKDCKYPTKYYERRKRAMKAKKRKEENSLQRRRIMRMLQQ